MKPEGVFEEPYEVVVLPMHAGTEIGPVGGTTAALTIWAAEAGAATAGNTAAKVMRMSAATMPAMSREKLY